MATGGPGLKMHQNQIKALLGRPGNLRHLAIIGAVDTGRSTLIDHLNAWASVTLPPPLGVRIPQEDPHRVDVEPVFSTVYYGPRIKVGPDVEDEDLAATPPPTLCTVVHNLFNSHWPTLADGAILVYDVVEHMLPATTRLVEELEMHQMGGVIFMNKIDRLVFELQLSPAEIYQNLQQSLLHLRESAPNRDKHGLWPPETTGVVFGSALYGWGFTVDTFAHIYAGNFGVAPEKLREKFWGENYFDSASKTWYTQAGKGRDGKPLQPAFVQFVLTPIVQLMTAIASDEKEKWTKMIASLGLKPSNEGLAHKKLLKDVFRQWLPLHKAIFEATHAHVPNALLAQKLAPKRFERQFAGNDVPLCLQATDNGDVNGPLLMHVSMMASSHRRQRPFAVSRILSGTLQTSKPTPVMLRRGPDFTAPTHLSGLGSIYYVLGRTLLPLEKATVGNLCLLSGIDQFLLSTATLAATSLQVAVPNISPPIPVPATGDGVPLLAYWKKCQEEGVKGPEGLNIPNDLCAEVFSWINSIPVLGRCALVCKIWTRSALQAINQLHDPTTCISLPILSDPAKGNVSVGVYSIHRRIHCNPHSLARFSKLPVDPAHTDEQLIGFGNLTAFAAQSDGKRFATSNVNNNVLSFFERRRIGDPKARVPTFTCQIQPTTLLPANGLAFSEDGNILAQLPSAFSGVRLINTTNFIGGKQIGDTSMPQLIRISPRNDYVVTVNVEGAMKVYSFPQLARIASTVVGEVGDFQITRDQQTVVVLTQGTFSVASFPNLGLRAGFNFEPADNRPGAGFALSPPISASHKCTPGEPFWVTAQDADEEWAWVALQPGAITICNINDATIIGTVEANCPALQGEHFRSISLTRDYKLCLALTATGRVAIFSTLSRELITYLEIPYPCLLSSRPRSVQLPPLATFSYTPT